MQTSIVSAAIPLSFKAAHLTVLIGNFTGNALLRLISSATLVGGGTETSRHFLSSSFVSSSKGTPWGEPNVFSHDISGGSFASISWRASSSARLFCKRIRRYANWFRNAKTSLIIELSVEFMNSTEKKNTLLKLNRRSDF